MNVVIVGAGGHGRVVLDILRQTAEHNPVGFIDADPNLANTSINDIPVLGPVNLLPKLHRQDIRGAIIAIGDNRIRLSYADLVLQSNLELINAIHPSAVISPTARLGKNTVIAAGAIIGTCALLADHVIINTAAVIDHECRLGPAVHVCPGALLAGRVEVEEGGFIGMGAKIIQCLKVGPYATVGAGAVVLHDVPPQSTVVGIPAKLIKSSPPA